MIDDLHKCIMAEHSRQSDSAAVRIYNVTISEHSVRKYSVEVHLRHCDHRQLKLKIDVLCSFDVLAGTGSVQPDGFVNQFGRDKQVEVLQAEFFNDDQFTMNPDCRRLFQPLVSEAAVFDMRNAHEDVRRLVRLLKLWAWSSVCTRGMATALSSVMEQVALHVWSLGGGHWTLDRLFLGAVQQLSEISTMQVGNSTRKAINKECPRLVHQCDPLNNLLNTVDSRVFSTGYRKEIQSAARASNANPDPPVQWHFAVPKNAPLRTYRLRAMLQVFPNVHCDAPMCHTNDLDAKPTQLHRLLAAFLTLSVRAHYSAFAAAFANGQMHDSALECDLTGNNGADARVPLVKYSVGAAELNAGDPTPDVLADVVRLLSSVYRFNYRKQALVELELGVNATLTHVEIPLPLGGASGGLRDGNEAGPSGMVVLHVYHFVPDSLARFSVEDVDQ